MAQAWIALGMSSIKILLAEDQQMVLGALSALLELEPDLIVTTSCSNGAEAVAGIEAHQPDVVITDIEMPKLSGLEVAQHASKMKPAPKVIIVTTFARPGYLRRALDAGVCGYLLKDAPVQELAEAIRKVHAGGKVIAPELAAEAWGENDPLTDRERQVLRLAGEGLSTSEISQRVHLAEGTVRNYLSEAISKLHASNRVEAARTARKKGWL